MPRRTLVNSLLLSALVAAAALVAHLGAEPAIAATTADGPSWSVSPADTAQGVDRPNFEYAIDPGAVIEDSIEVQNTGAVPLTLALYAADAFTTREGNIDLLTAGEPSVDSGTWLTLEQSELTLQVGERAIVPFDLRVPVDAHPGDHPTGIVASLRSDDPNADVQLDRRLGSRMQIRVSGELVPSVEISGVQTRFTGTWNPLGIGTLEIDYEMSNTGNTRATATSQLQVSGPLGLAPTATAADQLPELLPGSTIDVHQRIEGIAALIWLSGSVQILPESVGIGSALLDPVRVEYSSPAIPATLLLILLAVAIAPTSAVLAVRRRRRRTSGETSPAVRAEAAEAATTGGAGSTPPA